MPTPRTQNADLEHQRLTSLINSMADGVLALDERGKILMTNGAALNILDVNSSLIGKSIKEILKVTDKNNKPVDLQQVILGTKTAYVSRDWRLIYTDGEFINLYISIAPVKLSYGYHGTGGYVVLLRDITREKSLEEERDEFINVVSHELRTPVTITEGNIGNAEFLFKKSGLKNDTIAEALRQAHAQTSFLAGLINDLATLSRADHGKLSVDIESLNVHELINDLVSNYRKSAETKGLKLNSDLDDHLELLQSGRLYICEILQNFVTNAIKYTEQGSVTLGARQKQNGVEFFVTDTGIGISKTDRERVFDKFFRADNSMTRAASGTGLGLYITMKLARLLRAKISLDSELGHGSTFRIFIPNLK